jgi:hypothetical protein
LVKFNRFLGASVFLFKLRVWIGYLKKPELVANIEMAQKKASS